MEEEAIAEVNWQILDFPSTSHGEDSIQQDSQIMRLLDKRPSLRHGVLLRQSQFADVGDWLAALAMLPIADHVLLAFVHGLCHLVLFLVVFLVDLLILLLFISIIQLV